MKISEVTMTVDVANVEPITGILADTLKLLRELTCDSSIQLRPDQWLQVHKIKDKLEPLAGDTD